MGTDNISVEIEQLSVEIENAQWCDFYEDKKEKRLMEKQPARYFLETVAALITIPITIFKN